MRIVKNGTVLWVLKDIRNGKLYFGDDFLCDDMCALEWTKEETLKWKDYVVREKEKKYVVPVRIRIVEVAEDGNNFIRERDKEDNGRC